MTLRRIQVSDFRCLGTAAFDLDPHFTLVTGPNASGKTSVLEAIYILGRGRSFRTRKLGPLIRTGASHFVLHGELNVVGRRCSIGFEGSPQGLKARMDGAAVPSLSQLAAVLPVQIIDPEVHRLIEEGPGRRRRFLDWGVFHVEPRFWDQWRRYRQALLQRNAALKARAAADLVRAWDPELITLAETIHRARQAYIDALVPAVREIARRLLDVDVTVGYRPGWDTSRAFADALAGSWPRDQAVGTTQVGPQRAELTFRANGMVVRDRISRGQQKLLAAALLIAQLRLLRANSPAPLVLLDDPAAELDQQFLVNFIAEVRKQSAQLVVTAIDPDFAALGAPVIRYSLPAGCSEGST
ncbi:MAG: DNA replication/repair protein RecF [Pseudomonadota bacterium]|nr:DNA replication/repair protein RecF [Pseudomonadota bacterium]